jgi:Domain of Unknown Function (DUF1080)
MVSYRMVLPRNAFAAVALAACGACGDNADDGWAVLFKGTDLGGWSGDPTLWRVEQGAIVARANRVSRNTYLIHDGEFANFELEARVLVINAGSFPNSGMMYRAQVTDAAAWQVNGYQSDIGINYWASLYEDVRGTLVAPTQQAQEAAKYGEWNELRIVANGSSLRHEINGVVAVELEDTDPARRTTGAIAVQYHVPGEGFEVRFADIRIRILD